VAARGARAAGGDAGGRVPQLRLTGADPSHEPRNTLAELYRERDIQRAPAAVRDPALPLN